MFLRSQHSAVKADPIVKQGELLKDVCEPVKDIDEGLKIVDKLRASLKSSPIIGIGLAANQIGINQRVFVMNIPYDSVVLGYAIINPEITELKHPILFDEGCLSFPGQSVKTLRYNQVFIKDDLNPEGRWFDGLAAVCAQHENDHLDGITMYERQFSKIKPSDICRCGSGKKSNKCCLPLLKNRNKNG